MLPSESQAGIPVSILNRKARFQELHKQKSMIQQERRMPAWIL